MLQKKWGAMMAEYKDVTLIVQEIEQGKHNLKFKNAEYAEVFSSALAFFQGVIDRVRVAVVVEVVRCKDCKLYSGKYCTLTDDTEDRREPNDYCSCGERKEDENGKL